ncbi:hypothetical protein FOF46_06350 [Aquimarina algiphila]|uniref:Lipocalin-like domain-containing protein n=2 Tax=Flavobacteriaceae TaxID=49546 RepID=A0A554VNG3_9FLAO|nr:hypothetical protein FOF46_06350 [Aquimarina algiphila]
MIKMKKFAMLLFLASTSLFFSCSSDDDAPTEVDQNLIPGEWNLTEVKSENGKVSATIQNIPVSGDFTLTGKDYTAKATFTETSATDEPNTFVSSGGFTAVATISIPTQDPIEYEEPIPDFIGTGEWKTEGNILTTTVAGEEESFEIVSLTAETMTLKITINEDIERQGITFAVTGDQIFTLTKN